MPQINFQYFSQFDSQDSLISKLNYNFDQITDYMGGNLADTGPTGERGMIGKRGPKGATGKEGRRGSRWFLSLTGPTGSNVSYQDIWLDNDGDLSVLGRSGWGKIGNLTRTGSWKKVSGVPSSTNTTFNQVFPDRYALIIADDTPDVVQTKLNPQGAKMVISTNPDKNGSNLLEFVRADADIAGSTGSKSEFAKHPTFSWYGGSKSLDMKINSEGAIAFNYTGSQYSSFSVNSSNNIDLKAGSVSTLGENKIHSGGDIKWSSGRDINFSSPGVNWFLSPAVTPSGAAIGDSAFNQLTDTLYPNNLTPDAQQLDGYLKIYRGVTGYENPNGGSNPSQRAPLKSIVYQPGGSSWNASEGSLTLMDLRSSYSGQTLRSFYAYSNGITFTRLTSELYLNRDYAPDFRATSSLPYAFYAIPPLDQLNGRTIYIDPTLFTGLKSSTDPLQSSVSSFFIGFDSDDWSSSRLNFLQNGESVTFRIMSAYPNSLDNYSWSGFVGIAKWTTTKPNPNDATVVGKSVFWFGGYSGGFSTAPIYRCPRVDVTITKSPSRIRCFWKAYSFGGTYYVSSLNSQSGGGWGGSFNIWP
jgi:hypothetical protein